MLMMCWFYCVDLVWFLYYALGPIVLLCALFALKRGIANERKGLRQAAFLMMSGVAVKMFLADPLLRGASIKRKACELMPRAVQLGCDAPETTKGLSLIIFLGLVLFAVSAFAIWEAYKLYMPAKSLKRVTPDEIHLRFWSNLSFTMVVIMVCWQLAPWVGYLTVGCVPKMFILLTWQHLAVVNLGLLTVGFWKLESCVWQFKVAEKERMKYMHSQWTPKDTLWMTVFVFLVTLAMSYVAHDLMVRTKTVPESCKAGEVRENKEWNVIDLEDVEVYR